MVINVSASKAYQKIEMAGLAQSIAFFKKVMFEAYTRVLKKTPVDTGHLRQNWQISFNRPPSYALGGTNPSGAPSATQLSKIDMVTDLTAMIGSGGRLVLPTAIISNMLPYAETVDKGLYPSPPKRGLGKTIRGYSKQAPKGMTRPTIDELNRWLNK